MTGRERIEAAFSPDGTGEIPAVICYEGIYVRDHWGQLTSRPWWHQFSPDLQEQLSWRRDVIAKTPQDWFRLPDCPARAERAETFIEERGEGVFRVNRRTGGEEKLTPPAAGGSTSPVESPQLPETVEQVDASIASSRHWDVRQFVGGFDPDRFVAEGRDDLAGKMLEEFGSDLYPYGYTSSPLWMCYYLWGFEGMMILIAEKPDLVRRACRRHLTIATDAVRQASALGAEAVWIEEAFMDMISPAAYESLGMPVIRQIIEQIRLLGMKSIYYYSGDPAGKWEQILSLGMDALAVEESKKDFTIDIEEVAERVAGRCTLLGNLDAIGVLQDGSDEQLRAEVARQIAAGRKNGSRFIMSLGSPPTPATPVSRVKLYLELARELGGR